MIHLNNDVNINSVPNQGAEGNSIVTPQVTPETNQPAVQPDKPTEAGKPEGEQSNANPELSKPKETKPAERTVPYSRFQEINRKLREAQRNQAQSGLNKYDPNDLNSLREHPYVQDLELKIAEAEIKRGAEEILDKYPNLPAQIKKAILRNPRGYLQPSTTDVQTALGDIEDYLEEIYGDFNADANTPAKPKDFPVAGNNAPTAIQGNSNPAEVERIRNKPLEDWTESEVALMRREAQARGIRPLS